MASEGCIVIGKREATIKGLLARGYVTSAPLTKYSRFGKRGQPLHYLVGTCGALRSVVAGGKDSSSVCLTNSDFHRELAEIGGYRWPAMTS